MRENRQESVSAGNGPCDAATVRPGTLARMSALVHLVDASPYIFRAWFALPESLVDPQGRPVGAVYGFAGFLLRLLGEREPSHLGVAFDGSLTTSFRNEIHPGYKSSRERPPAELEAQLAACREMAEALGAATFVDRRYEADDLLAALVVARVGEGDRVVLVSGDKDLAQLVGPTVELWDFARDERYGPRQVEERWGVRPAQVADLLALAGDPVDDIPGVAGVGKKTATALLRVFPDLEALYDDLERVDGLPIRGARGVRRRLEEGRESAFLSRRLAVVAREAPAHASREELRWRGADRDRLRALCDRLGFDSLMGRVPRFAAAAKSG